MCVYETVYVSERSKGSPLIGIHVHLGTLGQGGCYFGTGTLGRRHWAGCFWDWGIRLGVSGLGHSSGCFWQGHSVGFSGAGALGVFVGFSFWSFGLGSVR